MKYEDQQDRADAGREAAQMRRDVWISTAVSAVRSNRNCGEAVHAANVVLAGFDEAFPEVVVAADGPDDGEDEE